MAFYKDDKPFYEPETDLFWEVYNDLFVKKTSTSIENDNGIGRYVGLPLDNVKLPENIEYKHRCKQCTLPIDIESKYTYNGYCRHCFEINELDTKMDFCTVGDFKVFKPASKRVNEPKRMYKCKSFDCENPVDDDFKLCQVCMVKQAEESRKSWQQYNQQFPKKQMPFGY